MVYAGRGEQFLGDACVVGVWVCKFLNTADVLRSDATRLFNACYAYTPPLEQSEMSLIRQCFIPTILLFISMMEPALCIACSLGESGTVDGVCTICEQGLHKDFVGAGECTACGPNTHASPGKGATSCIPCSGSAECQCAAGHGLYGNVTDFECRPCETGSYSIRYGLLRCILCLPGYYLNIEGGEECKRCEDRKISVAGATNCYESCAIGTYLTGTGCMQCPDNSDSVTGSVDITNCICNIGYTASVAHDLGDTPSWCGTCSAGYYSNTSHSNLHCIICPENNMSVDGSNECFAPCLVGSYLTKQGCMACHTNSSTAVYGSTCVCDKGYTGGENGFACSPCAMGTYKDIEGVGECNSCIGLNYSPLASTDANADCTCRAGTFLNGGTCTDCPAGTFKETNGVDVECTECGIGNISTTTGATTCTPCGHNEGTGMTYTPCIPCNATNDANCVGACMSGTDAATSRTSCRGCSVNEMFDNATAACICNPDYHRPPMKDTNSNACMLCPEDTFKPVRGDEHCTPCRQNSHRVNSVDQGVPCACKAGAFEDEDLQRSCVLCALGTFKDTAGDHACTACDIEQSTDEIGSTAAGDCKCAAGSYSTDLGKCEACPIGTFSAFVGDGDISQCRICPYKKFQPLAGQKECLPMFVSLLDAFEPESRVVGLFLEGATSCAYVSRDSTSATDKICWGEQADQTPKTTRNVMSNVGEICGDGVIHPILEECDDGNYANGDGCSTTCKVEHDFFCEAPLAIANITKTLEQQSVCCRFSGNPPSHTPKCARCLDRKSPYPGVFFQVRDCSLRDVDECFEGTDGCVRRGDGTVCANRDAREDHMTRFECECPRGEFMSDSGCIPERFASRFLLDLDTGTVIDVNRLKLYIREHAYHATGTNVTEVRMDEVSVGLVQFTMFVGSWNAMQNLTAKFNTTSLKHRISF